MLSGEQPVWRQAVHVTHRHFRLASAERQFDGLLDEARAIQVAAGVQTQTIALRHPQFALQRLGDSRQQAIPDALVIQRLEQRLHSQQPTKQRPALAQLPQLVAKIGGNPG
ncbi:hypothetical protein FQZ97_1165920 [compost metagenome]